MNQIAIYQSEGGAVDVRLDGETVWLTQEQMTQLFGRERSVITKHIRNVFKEGELDTDSVCANFAHTANDGKSYQVLHYNLDVIISVGYRVKSPMESTALTPCVRWTPDGSQPKCSASVSVS
jgi:hypothetical protein